ncbi:MAG: SGNH/GDSL hydrolase family protein [Candidatus Schekmanbacteria bacterium]|nr:SGNH/GDSL hydrolase family protein [Candidatus Schekmanbacteria bacterium]
MSKDSTLTLAPFLRVGRVAATIVYAVLCGELIIRAICYFVPIYDIEMIHYAKELKVRSTIPGVSHEHRPAVSAHLMGVDVTLNSLGHRGPELATPKPPREKRIHFLGSSITLGWGVAEKDTFVSLVGARFNQELAPRAGSSYAVINSGIGNYNIYYEVELFKKQMDRTQPDIVAIQYYINDAEVKPEANDSPLLKYSELSPLVYLRLKELVAVNRQSLSDYYLSLYTDGQPGWEQVKASLAELGQICARRRIPLVAFLIPELHDLAATGPYPPIYEIIKTAMGKLGIAVIDTYPPLREAFKANPAQAWIARDDPHPGIEAHRIIADVLFADLSRRIF